MFFRKWLTNKRLFVFHGWLGLSFGLILLIVCLSGSFAVVSHEIDWLLTPTVRAPVYDGPVNWKAIAEELRRQYPDQHPSYLWAPEGPGFAAQAWLPDRGTRRRIFFDPASGRVLGETPWFNTQRFFRDFHRRFFWYSTWGITLVSSLAVMLLFSAVTGLLFYKRWWAKLFTLRVHKGRRLFWSDLHRLTGVWTLLFTLVIAITGIWYLVEKPATRMVKDRMPDLPRAAEGALADLAPLAVPLPIEQYVRIARNADPELHVAAISLPARAGHPVQIQGQAEAWLVRDRANKLLLDPYTGQVLMHQRAEDLDPLVRWIDTADPLHFGNFGGLTTKLIWFAFGIVLSAAMPTGAYLWVKRVEQIAAGTAKRLRGEPDVELAHEVRRATKRRTGFGLLVTTAILLLAATTTFQALSDQLPETEPVRTELVPRTLGPWTIRPFREGASAEVGENTFGIAFDHRAGHPNFRRALLALSEDQPQETEWIAAQGELYEQKATLTASSKSAGLEKLWLMLETWGGDQHMAEFDLDSFTMTDTVAAETTTMTAWQSLGGMRVICFYVSFMAVVLVATVIWYRVVWFRRPPQVGNTGRGHSHREMALRRMGTAGTVS